MSGGQQEAVHRVFGSVRIIDQRNHGIELRIRSDEGHVQWVRRHELLRPPTATPPGIGRRQGTRMLSRTERESRTIIEALRYGINPGRYIDQFTFGRDAEIATMKQWLSSHSVSDATRMVIGAYGQGKSHFLKYVSQLALEQGYAVALIEVDNDKAPFSRPKRLYQQVMRSLSYIDPVSGETEGARSLIRRIVDAGLADGHPYLSEVARYNDDWRWEWLLAENLAGRPYGTQVPSLPDVSTKLRIYSYLLTSIGYLSTRPQIGLRGILLLFDECEALYGTQTPYNSRRGFENATELVTALAFKPLDEYRMSSEAHTLRLGSNTPSLYPPAYNERRHGLKLLMAFTAEPQEFTGTIDQRKHLHLTPLDIDVWATIINGVVQHHQAAYYYELSPGTLRTFFPAIITHLKQTAGSLRLQIKILIEALDILRHHPDRSPQELFSVGA